MLRLPIIGEITPLKIGLAIALWRVISKKSGGTESSTIPSTFVPIEPVTFAPPSISPSVGGWR